MKIDFESIRSNLFENFKNIKFNTKEFEDGDFGSLKRIEFESLNLCGNIDFWGKDWFGIFVWDLMREEIIINKLLEPYQAFEKEQVINELYNVLKK